MARFGPVGIGWTVTIVVDQTLGFLTSGLESTASPSATPSESLIDAAGSALSAPATSVSALHLVLACIIGLVAGLAGGWVAATIEDDSIVSRTLAILLVFSALVSAGLASMAGYSSTGWTWLVGGICQGAGAFAAGRLKYG
jgi:small-conductance mechanosensitive channel